MIDPLGLMVDLSPMPDDLAWEQRFRKIYSNTVKFLKVELLCGRPSVPLIGAFHLQNC